MKTLLFDLDGTLLPLEFGRFFRAYIKAISGFCAQLIPPDLFQRVLLESTEMMVRNDGAATNQEVFMRSFLRGVGISKDEIYPVFEEFYATEFPKLKEFTAPTAISAQIIEAALAGGWQIILATNPLFPRQAIEERMCWAGIHDYPWRHITSYETCHACKPNLLYYREIIENYGLDPGMSWMVGNDCQEDMVAKELGFNTYLVKDYLIKKNDKYPVPDKEGSLSDLLLFVKNGLA